MKHIFIGTIAALSAMGLGTTAVADDHKSYQTDKEVEVLERNDQGKATLVKVGDRTYPVCMNESMTDGCIQPRAAGLGWGPYPANSYDEAERS